MRSNVIAAMALMGLLAFLVISIGEEVRVVSIEYGDLRGSIGNVFGDPVAGARVSVNGKVASTDEGGEFQILQIPHGFYICKVEAPGYREYRKEISINGDTTLKLRYDLGLWPSALGIDFHVYYNQGYDGNPRAFAEIGIANGGEKNYYLVVCTILDPYGKPVKDFLDKEEAYRNFTGGLSESKYIREPRLAVVVGPGTLYIIKSIVIKDVPVKGGRYTLEVFYGDIKEHENGTYRRMTVGDIMDLDEDWNPHTP